MFRIVFAIALFVPTLTATAADSDVRRLSLPDPLTAAPGDTVELTVGIDNAEGVRGCRVAIRFATETVTFVRNSVTLEETIFSGFMEPAVNDLREGWVVFSTAASDPMPAGGGSIARLAFRVVESASPGAVCDFELHPTITRLNDGLMPIETHGGRLSVRDEPPGSMP